MTEQACYKFTADVSLIFQLYIEAIPGQFCPKWENNPIRKRRPEAFT